MVEIIRYKSTNSFFTLCIEFYFSHMQTKLCKSCPHHIEGLASLYYVIALEVKT